MWNHSYCGQQPKTFYLLLLFCLVGSLIVKGRPPIHLVLFCCMFVVCFFFCSWNTIFQNGEYWPSVLPMANSFLPWDRESDEVSKFRNNYKLLKLIWRFSFPKRQLQMKSKNYQKYCQRHNRPKLILVSTKSIGGSVLFSSRCTLWHRECEVLANFGYFVVYTLFGEFSLA